MRALKRWSVLIYAVFLFFGMLSLDDSRLAGNAAFAAMTVTMWVFIGLYLTFANWHHNREGRALIGFMFSVALVCTQSSVNLWITDYWGRLEIRALLLFGTAITMAWLTWVLAMSLESKSRKQNSEETASSDPPREDS